MMDSKWILAAKNNAWALIVLAVFGSVYACSLVFTYFDPDDALAIEYHVLGRNDAVQPPHERFQMAMDAILTLLPADEPILLTTAMGITSIAAIGLALLLLRLCFDWMDVQVPRERALLAVAVLLAFPEFIYLGLLYTPILVGMCFAIGAHLLLRRTIKHAGQYSDVTSRTSLALAASGIMMGLGGLFRWDILAYGLVVVLDIALGSLGDVRNRALSMWNRARVVAVWGIIALVTWLGMELLRGDLPQAIAETRVAAIETSAEFNVGNVMMTASLAMFFTPAFLVLTLAGWFLLIRKRGPMRWFVVAMSFSAALWPFWSSPKEVLVLVPFLGLLFAYGLSHLWKCCRGRAMKIFLRSATVLLLLAPWFLGVQLLYGDSAWGPGFGLRPFTHPQGQGIQNARIALGDGAGFPTFEGPRPFFGHASVLLAGKWRELAKLQEEEHLMAVRKAIQDTLPYVVIMHYDAFQMNYFARMGYTTSDPDLGRVVDHPDSTYRSGLGGSVTTGWATLPVVRRLNNSSGQQRILMYFALPRIVKDTGSVLLTIQNAGSEKVLVWGEPGVMRRLFLFAPEALQELGPHTALLDLRLLLAVVRSQSTGG